VPPLIIVGFVVIFVVVLVLGYISSLKRREAMAAVAAKLGLQFMPHKDKYMPNRYRFLNKLRQGSRRYAFNVLSGSYREHEVILFDYHYQTGSGKNTHHHYISFFILHLPVFFPELIITPEGIFSRRLPRPSGTMTSISSRTNSAVSSVFARRKRSSHTMCATRG
jgi:hypothetical protein